MSTVVTVSLSKCPNYELSLNKTQEINVTNKEYVVLKTEFESGHRYCLEVEHLDYTSYIGDITIYNETGYSDFNIDHSRGWRPQESSDSTEFYELSIKNGGTYAINILVIGDGKISVVVKDITQEEQIIQPDILLIVGIGCIGLISGLILGRASLFGSKSELHMS
jgi:hypothetical protein